MAAKTTPFTAILVFFCFSCIYGSCLSRSLKSSLDSHFAVDVDDEEVKFQSAGKGVDWFHPLPHPHPWPHAYPPLPANLPKIRWSPFVHPPLPAGGFRLPPRQWVHPPIPAIGKPRSPFVHPPLPCPWWKRNVCGTAGSGSGVAAPPPPAA